MEKSVDRGLAWLVRHQSQAGSWNPSEFSERCVAGVTACDNLGDSSRTVEASALAVLAFLGAGHTGSEGRYAESATAGLRFLIEHQQPSGAFGSAQERFPSLAHTLGTLAVLQAYDRTQRYVYKKAASIAVQHLLTLQLPQGGFPAGHPDAPPSRDAATTSWALMALLIARSAGIDDVEAALSNTLGDVHLAAKGVFAGLPAETPNAKTDRAATLTAVLFADPHLLQQDASAPMSNALKLFAGSVTRHRRWTRVTACEATLRRTRTPSSATSRRTSSISRASPGS